MNNVISALCGTVNFMPPWIMLGVFGAIILLVVFIIALKGVKRKFFRVLIYILVGLIPTAYLVYLVVQIALWEDVFEIIAFVITWLPTVIFVFFVVVGLLRGMRRGLRKSLILALQAAGAGVVCIAFFFTMVYVKDVDAGYLKFINWLMGGDGALQSALGVPESCSTFKEVLAEYIPVLLGGDSGLGPIIKDNTAYIYTLVDLVYRINFGVYAFSLFFGIDFILYLVYVFCYSEHKYKRIQKFKFINGKTDRDYKKHWVGGGAVGLVRGALTGLLCMSFIGSIFFIVAGGKGDEKLNEDYDFGNNELNGYYRVYRSIEEYGSEGILKILNAITDSADTPYYLFAADLMLSGELKDEELGISENIKFREELAAFTGFAHDTRQLLMKYGFDEIKAIIGGEAAGSTFDTVVQIATKPGFKEEFDSLIDAFDAQTYIINLSMSLVNSVVSNIDVLGDTVGAGERELIKLIFRKGFLSENIPDESALMEATGKTEAEGDDIRPYLTINHLLTKKDVKVVLNLVLSMLAGEETGDTLQLVKRVSSELSKLSILSTERKDEFNPVLGRMYCLFENLYLTADGSVGVTYSEIVQNDIDWIGEINKLLDAVSDTLTLYNNLSGGEAEEGEETGALSIVKNLFDEKNEHYIENMKAYDNICELLTESRVLGRALSTNFVYRTISEALLGLSNNIYIPEKLNFGNTYDENGNVTCYGETYQLLHGVKLLFSGDNAGILDSLLNMGEDASMEKILDVLAEAVKTPDDNGNTLTTYLTKSVILRSVISIKLIEAGGNTFYVPQAALEKVDGEYKNLITEDELKGLLDNITELVDFVMPFVGNSTDWETEIDKYLIGEKSESFYKLVETNRIFEGTVARLFNEKLKQHSGSDVIVIPKALEGFKNIDGWITIDGRRGELLHLLDALRYTKFSIAGIILNRGDFASSSVLKKISAMNEDELEKFFSSSVLHYTVSKYILGGATIGKDFVLIVPVNSCQVLKDDLIEKLIKKSELISVFGEITKLGLFAEDESVDVSKILVKIIKNKSLLEGSKIIPASIVATIINNDIANDLAIPQKFKTYGQREELEQYDSTNPWTGELPALLDALDELLGISKAEDDKFSFDDVNINDEVSGLLLKMNDKSDVYPETKTKLHVLYDSEIFRSKITKEVDDALLNNNIVEDYVISYVKFEGYYKFDELKALADAVNVLEISSLNDLNEFDFNTVSDFNHKIEGSGETKLNVVYRSNIVKGIITKTVRKTVEENEDVVDHPLAFESYLHVYRESEIESLIAVFDNVSAGKVDIKKVGDYGKYYYDTSTHETKSYILVASSTKQLLTQTMFIVPEEIYDSANGIIQPKELMLFANALDVLLKDDNNDALAKAETWDEDTPISIPTVSSCDKIFDSIIMRARVTYQLADQNRGSGQVLAVKQGNYDTVTDMRDPDEYCGVGKTAAISKAQLLALVTALTEYRTEGEDGSTDFKVPDFNNFNEINEMSKNNPEKLYALFASDIIRYRICDLLSKRIPSMDKEDTLNLQSLEAAENYTAEAEEVIQKLNQYSST